MGVSRASEKRYSDPGYVAAYLEAEWFDLLFGVDKHGVVDPRNPMPSDYYKNIAQFVANNIKKDPETYCDVGSATGRMVYEWLLRFPKTREVLVVEPSKDLLSFSKSLRGNLRTRNPLQSRISGFKGCKIKRISGCNQESLSP